MMDIRMMAYKMNISPGAAENLANEVGEELVYRLLEKVRLMAEHQKALSFHPKKKSNATMFVQAAAICRRRHRAEKREYRTREARRKSVAASRSAHEKGYRPDVDTLYGQLEDGVDSVKGVSPVLTYEDFKSAKRFLDSLEEDEA